MSTFVAQNRQMLANLITSKTRLRLLVRFFIHAAQGGYLRGLASEMDENTNAIRKELNNLHEAGYLTKTEQQSKVYYNANTAHPLFSLLQTLVRKHMGLDEIIAAVLDRIGTVEKIYIIGDYAHGIDSGKLEIVLQGQNFQAAYLTQLEPKIAKELQKQVTIHTTDSFTAKGLLVYEA